MSLLPVFDDNYIFILSSQIKKAIVIDPGSSEEVIKELQKNQQDLKHILITHCHSDHIGGLEHLVLQYPEARVYGPARLAQFTNLEFTEVKGEDRIDIDGLHLEVFHLPGHTLDHLAYYAAELSSLFSGDVLFGLGCGRLFEGSAEQGFESLQRIKALPAETRVYCAHEYTEKNMKFARQLLGDQRTRLSFLQLMGSQLFDVHCENILKTRENGSPTVPLLLRDERAFNPFLNCSDPTEFALIRNMRNHF